MQIIFVWSFALKVLEWACLPEAGLSSFRARTWDDQPGSDTTHLYLVSFGTFIQSNFTLRLDVSAN